MFPTDARLVEELCVNSAGEVIGVTGGGGSGIHIEVDEKQDVTGGMRAKLKSAVFIASKGHVPVYIAQVR